MRQEDLNDMKVENLIGKTYKEVVSALSIEEYGGDCGGWAYHTFYDEVVWHPGHENAVLSDVFRIDYSDEDEDSRNAIMSFFSLSVRSEASYSAMRCPPGLTQGSHMAPIAR